MLHLKLFGRKAGLGPAVIVLALAVCGTTGRSSQAKSKPEVVSPHGPGVSRLPVEAADSGPHLIYIQQGKQWRLVCDVERDTPFVLINGQREQADGALRDSVDPTVPSLAGNGYSLQPAEYFVPALVQVNDPEVRFQSQQTDRIEKLRKGISFRAGFEPSMPLKRVFLAFEVIATSGNHRFFLHELGDLQPRIEKFLTIDQAFPTGFEPIEYKLHLFAGGVEILHSAMPPDAISRGLDRLVAWQLKNNPRATPQPLIAPAPQYPPELREKKSNGRVLLAFHVTPEGRVEDPRVIEADDPAFNRAALAALAQWRFVPAVRDGKPIASSVNLPFAFAP